ncbi:MAG: ACT domain-containing protein [Actinomycetota bacterium]
MTAAALADRREGIRLDHLSGNSGLGTVRALSDAADEAVAAIWSSLDGTARTALLAVGEYGRRELAPGSTIELMLLRSGGDPNPDPSPEGAFEQLWAAGVETEYQSHGVDEAIALGAGDTQALLSFLDARLLAGDEQLYQEWMKALVSASGKSPQQFLKRLGEVPQSRHLRLDDATSGLEPDLKEGKGGLWDLAAIGWIKKVLGPQELAVEQERLEHAAELLQSVRCRLHWFTGRPSDAFEVHYQQPVAEALAGTDPSPKPEVDLMKSLYGGCRDVAFALDCLVVPPEERGEEMAAAFRQALGQDAGPWDPAALEAFIQILEAGADGRPALRSLDVTGDLARSIPNWDQIRCLPQHNIYHRFAVDVHCIETVVAASELRESTDLQIRSIAGEIFEDGGRSLLLGALFHDIGKGGDEDHSLAGPRLAGAAMQQMGIADEVASEAAWLVANHLLLTEAATKRDIGDEAMVEELADKVASERRLKMLYLLSRADAEATGPDAWSTWKATLVTRLFQRVGHILQHGRLGGESAAQMVRDKTEEIRSVLGGYPHLDELLAGMPREWVISQSPSALINQTRLMLEFQPGDEIIFSPVADRGAGVWEVTVIALDRPGLFSKISGALALHDLNIVGAEVYTNREGIALDAIRLEAVGDEEHRFEHVAEDALKALHGRLALEARLAEKIAAHPGRPSKGKQEPTKVLIANDASDFYTVIEVHAADRIGRLFAITRSVAELDVDIHLAKVSTYGHDIIDTFYVTDVDRNKIVDTEYLAEIEKAILHRLSIA